MNLTSSLEERLEPSLLSIAADVGAIADHHRLGAVLVGGVVRDLLLGRAISEVDIMLEFPSRLVVDDLAKRHNANVVFHEAFQTFAVTFPMGLKVDVTTARKETYAAPAKLPKVLTSPDIKIADDLMRRDFTINAMAIWINKDQWGDMLDPFNGLNDLKKNILRVLHDNSFIDDPTRIFRAARFAGRYGYQLDPHTHVLMEEALKKGVPNFLSPVRRRHEFEMILKEVDPTPALKLLIEWGLLPIILKEWTLSVEALQDIIFPIYDGSSEAYIERLKTWFSQWRPERAELMMTELSFEKKIKHQILTDTE